MEEYSAYVGDFSGLTYEKDVFGFFYDYTTSTYLHQKWIKIILDSILIKKY